MELSDKAYSTYVLLQRFTPLMNGLENAPDYEIEKVCRELISYFRENRESAMEYEPPVPRDGEDAREAGL